jgi:hypothetical protein
MESGSSMQRMNDRTSTRLLVCCITKHDPALVPRSQTLCVHVLRSLSSMRLLSSNFLTGRIPRSQQMLSV